MKTTRATAVVAVVFVLAFVLSACGIIRTDPATDLAQFEAYESFRRPAQYTDWGDDYDDDFEEDADENLPEVSVTIPLSLYNEITARADYDLTAFDSEQDSVALNDDSSITVFMTQEQHEEALTELTERLDSLMDEMIDSDEYPHFVFISHDDYSWFTVVTNAEALDENEREAALNLLAYSRLFCLFSGEDDSDCQIEFLDENTDEVLYTLYSSDLMDDSDYDEYDDSDDYML